MAEADPGRVRRAQAQRRVDTLALDLLGRPGVSPEPMFGTRALRAGERFFAFVGREARLVVKLPPAHTAALVTAGEAAPVRSGLDLTRKSGSA
jgi:hypothetical protein